MSLEAERKTSRCFKSTGLQAKEKSSVNFAENNNITSKEKSKSHKNLYGPWNFGL